jgi:lipopolysaccharide transport system ATP-binding protein
MSETIIEVENLSKIYKLGSFGTGTLSHDLNRWWHKMRHKEDPYLKAGEKNDRTAKSTSGYVWSLKDINFEIKQGEVFGIIGKNGAGKSTLLKLLSKITKPTTGEIRIDGTIASLLEVGTGFHPELTGRENIFLNGAILGMKTAEIKKNFDEIVSFSGVEKYIDTPVKRYSSGMYVRLAFAVSAHLEPEILIVDEVLSVGDSEFQQKCLGKMKDISARQGRTVLFVSHSMAAIRQLCTKGLLLEHGLQKAVGSIKDILSIYQEEETDAADGQRGNIPNNQPGYFLNWQLEGVNLPGRHSCYTGNTVSFCFGFHANESLKNCEVRFMVKYEEQIMILHAGSMAHLGSTFSVTPGDYQFKFQMDFPVRDAKFNIEVTFLSIGKIVDTWTSSTKLTVLDNFTSNVYAGVINPATIFSIEELATKNNHHTIASIPMGTIKELPA